MVYAAAQFSLELSVHSEPFRHSPVDLIDAGGLGALLELREWTQLMGIEFKLMNVINRVRQVFEITRLDSVFDIMSEEVVLSAATEPSSVVAWQTRSSEGSPRN